MSRSPSASLGISADYHDAAAALVVDGTVIAAAAEERFTRRKHDPDLPVNAMRYCVDHAAAVGLAIDTVAFYDKPLTAYERVLADHALVGPRGHRALGAAVSSWSRRKLWIGYRVERALAGLGVAPPRIVFAEHHQSHAASAFYPSPFDHAAVLTVDGVGEWATSSIAWGTGHRLDVLRELRYPDSVGLFYSTMTSFCGFEVNDGEYKLMGLAPYGEPRFAETLRDRVIQVHDDGSVTLDQRWFSFRAGSRMAHPRLAGLLGGPAAPLGAEPGQREADIAASTQVVLDEVILRMAREARSLTGERQLCLAGGVALNCVANGRLRRDGSLDDVWIQPAAGDDGGAVGAALWAWHQIDDHPRTVHRPDGMAGAALGPEYPSADIAAWLRGLGMPFEELATDADVAERTAVDLAEGRIVGWFCGRSEFGPRALGHRSILADPRDPAMIARLNGAVKRREGFRPFAPAVLAERAGEWFDLDGASPYMLLTCPVRGAAAGPTDDRGGPTTFAERLAQGRSPIPAVTHVDGSARVQTVDAATAPDFHRLIDAFGRRTGCPVLVNTSFNRRGEPIVLSPADALRCVADTDIDVLVLERCRLDGATVRAILATDDAAAAEDAAA